MKNIEFITALILAPCVITACSAYVPPEQGPTATVSFVGDQTAVLIGDGKSCLSNYYVPDELLQKTTILAGRRAYLEVRFLPPPTITSPSSDCDVALSFEPAPGAHYVMESSLIGSYACKVAIFRVLPSGERVSEMTSKQERVLNCF